MAETRKELDNLLDRLAAKALSNEDRSDEERLSTARTIAIHEEVIAEAKARLARAQEEVARARVEAAQAALKVSLTDITYRALLRDKYSPDEPEDEQCEQEEEEEEEAEKKETKEAPEPLRESSSISKDSGLDDKTVNAKKKKKKKKGTQVGTEACDGQDEAAPDGDDADNLSLTLSRRGPASRDKV